MRLSSSQYGVAKVTSVVPVTPAILSSVVPPPAVSKATAWPPRSTMIDPESKGAMSRAVVVRNDGEFARRELDVGLDGSLRGATGMPSVDVNGWWELVSSPWSSGSRRGNLGPEKNVSNSQMAASTSSKPASARVFRFAYKATAFASSRVGERQPSLFKVFFEAGKGVVPDGRDGMTVHGARVRQKGWA